MRIRVAKPSGSKVEISVREDDKVETLRAMVVMMLEVSAPVPPIRSCSCICARRCNGRDPRVVMALRHNGHHFAHPLILPTRPEPRRMVEPQADTR